MTVKKELDDANLLYAADEVDAFFDVAKRKALESFGGFVPEKRDLPQGVTKKQSGKYQSEMWWGSKTHYIGIFDTPEEASAAFMSVKKDLVGVKPLALGAGEAEAFFNEARKKALESVVGFVPKMKELPRGVRETSSGRFESLIWWYGKDRYIGTFDAPEQGSAAYMSIRKYLDDAKLPPSRPENPASATSMFDEAKKKALETMGWIPMESDGIKNST